MAGSDAISGSLPNPVFDPAVIEAGRRLFIRPCAFVRGVLELAKMPDPIFPEVAFAGRSNVGKSSLINALTGHGGLARVSDTPGRTQEINFFELGNRLMLADLPGYGYAAVNKSAKQRWQKVMADYLAIRRSLSGVVLMVDSRLGLTDLDKQLLEFVAARVATGEIKLLVLLTKSDKLNRKEADAILRSTTEYLAGLSTENSDVAVTLFSALKKSGVGDVALALREWVLAHKAPGEVPDDVLVAPPDEADEG